MIRGDIIELIKEKITEFYQSQKRIFIITIPSTHFPNGKFYNGIITDVRDKDFIILDDKEDVVVISFLLIASPEDIQLSRRVE